MKIKVEYAKTNLEKALWSIQRKFGGAEFEPLTYPVSVRGLKTAKSDVDLSDLMNCEKQTGLTETEYQAKHHHAWSD